MLAQNLPAKEKREMEGKTVSELNHPNEINRDYIRLLQSMSRFIREEFSVSIRMTQEDAVEQLLYYAELSTNHVLQEMGKELNEFAFRVTPQAETITATATASPSEEGGRYYRGVPVADADHGNKTTAYASAEQAQTPKGRIKPVRVYRGQVING